MAKHQGINNLGIDILARNISVSAPECLIYDIYSIGHDIMSPDMQMV